MRRFSAVVAVLVSACAPVLHVAPPPPPSAAFVSLLGPDTLHAEQFTRTPAVLAGRAVTRAPRTFVRDFTYRYNPDGTIARLEVLTRPVDGDTVIGRNVLTFANDTAYVESGLGESYRVQWIPSPPVHVASAAMLPYSMLETAVLHAPPTVGDSVVLAAYFPPALRGVWPFVVKRVAPDTVTTWTRHMGTIRVHVDEEGRALSFDARGSSLNTVATREDEVPLDSLALEFAVRDAAGAGFGPASPRDTVHAFVHGANVFVDYGRPFARGREIFGGLVPWGQVWRTGANLATHITTDRDMVLGGLTLAAGTYTLWTVPREDGRWELVVNREVGQWGTLHDPQQDVGRIPMQVRRVGEPVEQFTIRVEQRTVGGELVLAWDTYEARVAFSPR